MRNETDDTFQIRGTKIRNLRYGENPQQMATLFSTDINDPLSINRFEWVEGVDPSYCNITDLDCLVSTMRRIGATHDANRTTFGLRMPYIAIGAKHGNACGAGIVRAHPGAEVRLLKRKALQAMLDGDRLAIFGGWIITNFAIENGDADFIKAEAIDRGTLFDGVIAPQVSPAAIEVLKRSKTGKCRFMVNPNLGTNAITTLDISTRFRQVCGGFLIQTPNMFVPKIEDIEKRGPDLDKDMQYALLMASAIGATSNSNTITVMRDHQLVANAVGQQSRVGAVKLAVQRAGDAGHGAGVGGLRGCVAYSDSFFPNNDAVEWLANSNVRAIFATTGSLNDSKVFDLCSQREISLWTVSDKDGRGFAKH